MTIHRAGCSFCRTSFANEAICPNAKLAIDKAVAMFDAETAAIEATWAAREASISHRPPTCSECVIDDGYYYDCPEKRRLDAALNTAYDAEFAAQIDPFRL